MNYININKKFTEITTEYIGKGYIINSSSMSGSQGETCKIDLTNGIEVIRILIDTFSDWRENVEGVEIIVGKATDDDVRPHENPGRSTIWNNRLEILRTERFYKIGEDHKNGTYYGTKAEAEAAAAIKIKRHIAHYSECKTENITIKAMEIAKRIIRRKFGVKRICEADIQVSKRNGVYTISYKTKSYRLH